jgi:DNA polymerase-4
MVDGVTHRLRRAGLVGRTVQVKLRYHDFRTVTRAHTLDRATDLAADVGPIARGLLDGLDLGDGVRLLGVSVSGLVDASTPVVEQLALESSTDGSRDDRAARDALERTIDAVRERFGADAVGSAARAERGRLRTGRGGSAYGPLAEEESDT